MDNSIIGEFSVLSPSQKRELERNRKEKEARKTAEAIRSLSHGLFRLLYCRPLPIRRWKNRAHIPPVRPRFSAQTIRASCRKPQTRAIGSRATTTDTISARRARRYTALLLEESSRNDIFTKQKISTAIIWNSDDKPTNSNSSKNCNARVIRK